MDHILFISRWTFGLFPLFSYCEHPCTIFSWTCVFNFLGCLLGSSISGSYLTFRWTAKLSSKVAAPFYIPTNNVWGFQFLQRAHQHWLFSFFLTILISLGVKCYLIVVSMCIFLVTNNVNCHIAMYWPFISLEKKLFKSFAHFKMCCLFIIEL